MGPSDRRFGLTFFVVFALIACWQAGNGRSWVWVAGISGLILLSALTKPSLLGPFNRLWMALGELLHHIVNPIVLGGMYFFLITPIGLFMRLRGYDPLNRNLKREINSYWIERKPPGPASDSFNRQF